MSLRHASVALCIGSFLQGVCGANETGDSGIKLAEWKIEEFSVYFCVILSLLFVTLFKMYYPKIPYFPDYIPQSLLLIVIGVIFGSILDAITGRKLEDTFWKLSPDMFFYYLLPPIVLDSAYGLYNRTFVDYLGSILIYAVIGTILNFLIIGPVMYGLDKVGALGHDEVVMSINAYLLFSSLIVAVDPVAVLAIFQDIGVEPGLYYMVFGESLLNDAVTIVLYNIMSEFIDGSNINGTQIGLGIVSFFTISLGGFVVGVIIGVISSFFTRWTGHFGCFLTIMMAYFSYIFGDCLGWSGIITMIGCGLVQADYAFHNISSTSLASIHLVVKEVAEISEAFIFFLIGVQLFSAEVKWDTGFCLWGMVMCFLSRAIVTLALTYIINLINLNDLKVTFKQQAILIYGGLRGAVALSLALLVETERLGENSAEVKKIIVTASLFIILFTVGVMGLTMKPLVKLFRIKLAPKEELSIFSDLNGNILDHVLAGIEAIIGSTGRNSVRAFFTHIDDDHIRPVLQRDPSTHDERLVRTYENIALKLHYAAIKPAKSTAYLEGLPETIRQKHLQEVGDSTLHLPPLATSTSDPRLLDFFSNVHDAGSASNLSAKSYEFSGMPVPSVRFEPSDTRGLDDENRFVDPSWRRRANGIDGGNEGFQKEFMSVLNSKAKASRFLKLKRIRSKAKISATEEESEAERQRREQTATNTAMNRVVTKPDQINTGDSNVFHHIPPKDYPSEPNTGSAPKFQIGDDD